MIVVMATLDDPKCGSYLGSHSTIEQAQCENQMQMNTLNDKGKNNNSEWRKQHEEMISAIRQAKKNAPATNALEPTIEMKV